MYIYCGEVNTKGGRECEKAIWERGVTRAYTVDKIGVWLAVAGHVTASLLGRAHHVTA